MSCRAPSPSTVSIADRNAGTLEMSISPDTATTAWPATFVTCSVIGSVIGSSSLARSGNQDLVTKDGGHTADCTRRLMAPES